MNQLKLKTFLSIKLSLILFLSIFSHLLSPGYASAGEDILDQALQNPLQKELNLMVRNVGGGNAVIFQNGNKIVLFDAGYGDGLEKEEAQATIKETIKNKTDKFFLDSLKVSDLTEIVLIISHPDRDHLQLVSKLDQSILDKIKTCYLGGPLAEYFTGSEERESRELWTRVIRPMLGHQDKKVLSLSHKIDLANLDSISQKKKSTKDKSSLVLAFEQMTAVEDTLFQMNEEINTLDVEIENQKQQIEVEQKERGEKARVSKLVEKIKKNEVERQRLKSEIDTLCQDSNHAISYPFAMHIDIPEISNKESRIRADFLCINAIQERKLIFAMEKEAQERRLTKCDNWGRRTKIDRNTDSAVVRLSINGKNYIFPGDATGETTSRILSHTQELDTLESEFLLASHHGAESEGCNNVEWALATTSRTVVFSAGQHSGYKHPRLTALYHYLSANGVQEDDVDHLLTFCGELGIMTKKVIGKHEKLLGIFDNSEKVKNSNPDNWITVKTRKRVYATFSSGDIRLKINALTGEIGEISIEKGFIKGEA